MASSFTRLLFGSPERSLVSPRDLQSLLGSVVIFDATWYLPTEKKQGKEVFCAEGHIPGARFFDVDEISDHHSRLPHMLPTSEEFSLHMDRLKVSNADPIIIYDRAGSVFSAPRAWWMLRAFGHENIALLNGGFHAWVREGGPIEYSPSSPSHLQSTSCSFEAQRAPRNVVDLSEVRNIVRKNLSHDPKGRESDPSNPTLVDARGLARFRGEVPEIRPGVESGHMPGAVCIPVTSLSSTNDLGEFASWKTPDQLQKLFAEANVDLQTSPIISTCGSGMTACAIAFAAHLCHVHDPVRVYDGSWTEYGSDPSHNPIVKE